MLNQDTHLSSPPDNGQPALMRSALVITKPDYAQHADTLEQALGVLSSHHLAYELRTPTNTDSLLATVRSGRPRHDVVVLASGDGTIHRALPALMGEGAPLGILPLGTANDLARTLGLPLDPDEAARVIATGQIRHVDIARVNNRYFINVAHIGLGANTQRELTPERKRRWRILSYPVSLLQTIRGQRPFRAWLFVDGQPKSLLVVHITVGNGRYFGGGVPVADEADIADGMLDVHCIRPGGVLHLARALTAVWRGKGAHHAIWRARGKQVTINTRRHHPMTADGERIGTTPATFILIPSAVQVLAPPPDPANQALNREDIHAP